MIIVHPSLPGSTLDVTPRQAQVYAKSGWRPASDKEAAALAEQRKPPPPTTVPLGQLPGPEKSEVIRSETSKVSELGEGPDVHEQE